MSQQRGTVTDRLLNVIQVLQLGKKTGHLTIEREHDTKQETGEVIFLQGQVTQAYGGHRRGQDALNWLSTWGACRYVFVPTTQEKVTDPLISPPNMPSMPLLDKTTRPLQAVNSPVHALAATTPQNNTRSEGKIYRGSSSALVIPHRTRLAHDSLYALDRAGLSRAHRQLFMLIDGSRTVSELMRITGRTFPDMQQLLLELEHIGVVENSSI